MSRSRVASIAGVAAGLLLTAVGCQADRLVTADDRTAGGVDTVLVVPARVVTLVGGAQRLAALVVRTGRDTVMLPVQWRSRDTTIARVAGDGTLLAVRSGTTSIVAERDGHAGEAIVEVQAVPVARVRLAPTSLTLLPGGRGTLVATALDQRDQALDGRIVGWASADTTIATVSAAGEVTARRSGSTAVVATVDGISAVAPVEVGQAQVATVTVTLNAGTVVAGQTTQAVAVLRDAAGAIIEGRTVSWGSNNTSVATVDAHGLVRAIGAGTTTLTGSSGGQTGFVTIVVTPAPVASIVLTPAVLSLSIGGTQQLAATVRDAAGNTLAGRTVEWSSAATGIATVSATGLLTGVAFGTTDVTARSEGVTSVARVTVAPAGQAVPRVVPQSASVIVGGTVQLAAELRDQAGNLVPGGSFTWASAATGVATVSATGVVTGVAPGTATVTATHDGLSASATITVQPVPVAGVNVEPHQLSVAVGQTSRVLATCRDAGGNVLTGRTVTWRSEAAGIAGVSALGDVTGVATGSTQVTATCEGHSAAASVTVTPQPVGSVTVVPGEVSVRMGTTTQLAATVRAADGTTLSGRSISWQTANPTIAGVSTTGVVTPIAPGTVVISATSEGRTGSATVTVLRATVASLTVSPATVAMNAGTTAQLTATARDASGNVIAGVVPAWSSSNAVVASVGSTGLVTANAAGSAVVVASIDGRTAEAAVTVQAVTPPPPGGTTIFSEGFESGSFAVWEDGYDANLHRIVTDPALARSGNRALEMRYVRGSTGAGFLTRFFMPGYDSVRVSYWVRFADNWQGGTYLVGLYGNRVDNRWSGFGRAGVCPNGTDFFNSFLYADYAGTPGDTRMYLYYPEMPRSGTQCWGDVGTTTGARYVPPLNMTRGVWQQVELVVRANTVGQRNGTVRMFVNGQLRGEWLNLQQRTTTNLMINALQLTGQYSGAGGVPQDQVLYVDDIVVTGGTAGSGGGGTTPQPTTVRVTPSAVSVVVGQTTTLGATVLDQSGATMTGQPIAWSSSNDAVATVSSAGVVTGRAAGSATIRATSGAISGTSAVTVTTTPPPADTSSAYANEPTGWRFRVDAPFNALTEGGWQPEAAHPSGSFRIGADATAPRSPSSVLEFVFPTGFVGGYSPGTLRVPTPFPDPSGSRNVREVYLGFHFKANPEWQGHSSHINKLGYGWLNNQTSFGLVWHFGMSATAQPRYMKQMAIFIGGTYFMFNTPQATDLQPGAWHKVEVQIRPSSAANRADGLVRVWVGGVLMADHPNVVTTSGYISDLYWSPTWGGAGGTKTQNDWIRFDHTVVVAR